MKTPLGSGLGGETWLADGPDGPVALKILRKENAFFGGFSSLLREALLLRSITHAHLVRYRGASARTVPALARHEQALDALLRQGPG